MNQNAIDDQSDSDTESTLNKELQQKFRPKSTWRPKPPNKTLDLFQRSVKQEILRSKIKPTRYKNTTKNENIGMNKLTSNPHIIIKKADKGSAVLVMNTVDYLREGYRQLQDERFYQKIPNDITHQISDKIAEELTKMQSLNLITEKNFDYLNVKDPKEARFYMLPKIHKKGVPGRPICSSIDHPTALLVTLDVSSLYTNIPNQEGLLAVADHLRKDPDKQKIGPHILNLL